MTSTVIDKAKGGMVGPSPMGTAEPDRILSPEQSAGFLEGSGLNGPLVANLLSEFLAHERCGARLYRVAREHTVNPMLRGRYEHFGQETEQHILVLEKLMTRLGIPAAYVSPGAHMDEAMSTKQVEALVLLTGEADLMVRELAMLEAVVLAETKDHADWQILSRLVEHVPEGEIRDALKEAVSEVEPQEDEHVRWATTTWQEMVLLQARSPMATKAEELLEKGLARVKEVLGS